MSTQENKAVMLRFIEEVINEGKMSTIDELVAGDVVNHNLPPGMPPGREGIKMSLGMLRSAFPDLHETIEDILAEGDRVVTRNTLHGSNQGTFFGMPPTGKQVSMNVIDIVRISSGKLIEYWQVADTLGMLQQLGVISPSGQAG